jgi:hypothetical protein
MPDIVANLAILSFALLGILIGLAGIVWWWVSKKMSKLT